MARLDFFTGEGAVNSPAHIRPANNGSFPLIDAHDVQVGSNPTDADDRLDATLEDIDAAINTINSELGSGSSDTNATIKKRLAAAETNIGKKVNTSDIQTTVRAAASASDSKIPSEKAVRSAIDNATVSTTATPASGSTAAFSAGGAYTELAKKVNTSDIQSTVNTSSNPPSSNAVKTYVDAADALKVNTSDIQTTVRAAASASDSKIPSEKAVRSAIDNATVSTTDTPTSGSAAAFSAGGAYTELAKKVNTSDVQSAVNTSTNPVSSNAVKTYVDAADATKVNTSDIQTTVRDASSASDSKIPSEKAVRSAIDSKTITIDSTVTEGSANAVSGGAVYTQLATKQNALTFDTTPTASSSNPVTSGGVKAALDNKQNTLTYETTPIVGSVNPVTSTGIRNAIDAAAASNLGDMRAQYAEFVADADDILEHAKSLSNGMVACSNIAAETTAGDTRILLYTGTTNSKYTNGHWYYNSAPSNAAPVWTDGGAVGSAPTIDNTLTTAGAAADSKSVGDAIENIVTISNTQPGANSGNKVWIKETTNEEVQVPTYEEHISKANKADITTNNESDNGSGTITASKAYAIGDHFYINNTNTSSENYGVSTLYKATAAIASGSAIVVGTNCEASKIVDDIALLSSNINTLNKSLGNALADLSKSGMQLLPAQENRTVTSNGVTFTMTNGVCHAQGTASNTAFIRLYYVDRYHLPDGIIPGATYHVAYETTSINLRLDFTFYSGGEQLGSVVYFVEDGDITIPATADGMMMRLSVGKDMAVNADASNIGIYSSLNNVELTNKVDGFLGLTKLEFTFPTKVNGYIDNTGDLVYLSPFVTTGYLKAEHKIAVSGHISGVSSSLYQINAYDIDKAYLGGILAGQATFDDMQVFSLPVGTKYIRITKSINSTRSFDVYCVNDTDYSSEANYVYSPNIFNVEKSIKGYYVNYQSGELVSNANYNASDKIRIMPGTEYYISNFEQMAFYDANEIYIGGIYYNNGILKSGNLPLSDDWITATGYNAPMTFVAQSNFAFVQTSITSGRLPFYTIKVNSADAGDYVAYYRTIPDLVISGANIIDSIDADKVLADVIAKPMTIKLIGDSITAGFRGTGYNATSTGGGAQIDGDVYTNVAGHCWANSLKAYWEDKFSTCTVKNYGWTGLNSATMLQKWSYLVDDDDDVLICTIGTNDRAARSNLAQYIYNLEVIVSRALYAGKKIILMANIPASLANETSGDKNFHMEDVEHAVRYVSNKRRVPFINLFELFTNYCQERNIDMNTLLADGLHPNDDGYDVMFYLITNALGISPKMAGATW